jgi:hypothetical protein
MKRTVFVFMELGFTGIYKIRIDHPDKIMRKTTCILAMAIGVLMQPYGLVMEPI